jgi:hypothetical protein
MMPLLFQLKIFFNVDILKLLTDIWNVADEGHLRLPLLKNALLASLYSPVVGFGIGSFSGIKKPFEGYEAHNTFLDFSLQFGLSFLQ